MSSLSSSSGSMCCLGRTKRNNSRRAAMVVFCFGLIMLSLLITILVSIDLIRDDGCVLCEKVHVNYKAYNHRKVRNGSTIHRNKILRSRTRALSRNSSNTSGIILSRDERYKACSNGVDTGVLSTKPNDFFALKRQEIDNFNNYERCSRYGYKYDPTKKRNRRLLYGALMANEPWELFEVTATETYGLYHAMAFVVSNRTQNFTPRTFQRLEHAVILQELYGTNSVTVKPFINENETLVDLEREAGQCTLLLQIWIGQGMTAEDVGILCDADEVFSRYFLRAIQVCEISTLDYKKHKCNAFKEDMKVFGTSQVYEGSPECITQERTWWHPELMIGACFEGIGNISSSSRHVMAPRLAPHNYVRADGWDNYNNSIEEKLATRKHKRHRRYALWSTSDLRQLQGGYQHKNLHQDKGYSNYTSYHFHNWFSNFTTLRHKYLSYGHPLEEAMIDPLETLHPDLDLMVKCAKNESDESSYRQRVKGGFKNLQPFVPIYFMDDEYRKEKHSVLIKKVDQDIQFQLSNKNLTSIIE